MPSDQHAKIQFGILESEIQSQHSPGRARVKGSSQAWLVNHDCLGVPANQAASNGDAEKGHPISFDITLHSSTARFGGDGCRSVRRMRRLAPHVAVRWEALGGPRVQWPKLGLSCRWRCKCLMQLATLCPKLIVLLQGFTGAVLNAAVRSFGECRAERDKNWPTSRFHSQKLFAKKSANTGDFRRSNFGGRALSNG